MKAANWLLFLLNIEEVVILNAVKNPYSMRVKHLTSSDQRSI